MMIPLLRPTTADFRKWCHEYIGLAFHLVQTYERNPLPADEGDYKTAQRICRQYKVLLASLEKKERRLFENKIMKNKAIQFSSKEERIAFSVIFENWKEICFPGKKYQLKTITKEQIGEKIKALRINNGYTRKQVADITGISEATLKAYENGDRMLRFEVAYLLAQVYRGGLDELV
ncbi:MAG: helix-turn-helix transcriptional regulator [Clostridia bacterium]|nr:helix-turn-helix transcriptional regulator [Clostridia bacterium]